MKDYRYFSFPKGKEGGLVIEGYGFETFERRKLFTPMRIINHYSVHFVIKGEGNLFIENKTYPLNKGALFLCPKGKKMTYHTSKTNPYTYFWINFSGEKAEEILKKLNLSVENPVFYPENFEQIKATFHSLVIESQTANENLAFSALYRILYLTEKKSPKRVNLSKMYCERIVEFIKLNYKDIDLKVSHIVEDLHLTAQYASRIFKAEMGESIVSFLISYRMEKAREAILNGYSVSEACFASGYVDLSNFSKTYKKTFGCSPRDSK